MDEQPVLFLDSGIGGLPYVEAVARRLPGERFIYIADTAHFPYGHRSEKAIRRIVGDTVAGGLEEFEPKLVVVACNTASVVALSTLRERYSVPFVGVVPAVKPAALTGGEGDVLVLSTARTADGSYLAQLIRRFAGGQAVRTHAAGDLVTFVEHRLPEAGTEERRRAVGAALRGLEPSGVRAVVLGCTHFTHLTEEIAEWFAPQTRLIDSRDGVARRVAELLAGAGSTAARTAAVEKGCFYVTGDTDIEQTRRLEAIARDFGLRFEGNMSWTPTH